MAKGLIARGLAQLQRGFRAAIFGPIVGLIAGCGLILLLGAAKPVHTEWKGKIAYIGDDGQIYTCTSGCDQPQCVTCPGKTEQVRAGGVHSVSIVEEPPTHPPVQYDWPTFSPDGRHLAYCSTSLTSRGPTYGVHITDLASRQTNDVFSGPLGRPIDLIWTPDQSRLLFLLSHAGNLSLMLAAADHLAPARVLLTGQPIFFDWNQSLNDVAINYAPPGNDVAKQVVLMHVTDRDQKIVAVLATHSTTSATPAWYFRTPSWSPDGTRLAWVADNGHGQVVLIVANADGSAPRQMVGLQPGPISFLWAPDSTHIAYTGAPSASSQTYDGIGLLDVSSGDISTVVRSPVTAFSFSPDSRKLAYVGIDDQQRYSWNVVDLRRDRQRKLVDFLPTERQGIGLRFFDQFALSLTAWSPDSRQLTFAGALLSSSNSSNLPPPAIWILPINGGEPIAAASGSVSFWSPKTAGK